MDRFQLQSSLRKAGVSADSYSLNGAMLEDRYVLDQLPNGQWRVYFTERGRAVNETLFNHEDDACLELRRRVLEDPTTRR